MGNNSFKDMNGAKIIIQELPGDIGISLVFNYTDKRWLLCEAPCIPESIMLDVTKLISSKVKIHGNIYPKAAEVMFESAFEFLSGRFQQKENTEFFNKEEPTKECKYIINTGRGKVTLTFPNGPEVFKVSVDGCTPKYCKPKQWWFK